MNAAGVDAGAADAAAGPVPGWWAALERDVAPELAGLRVGVYASGGAPYHHAGLLALWGLEPVPVRADAIREGALGALDVLIFPGGGATAMGGMLAPLGVDGAAAVRRWVEGGGMYLGSCAGSFLPASVGEPYWTAHPEARELHMIGAPLANGSDSAFEGLTSPGVGTIAVEVADAAHWLVEGLPDRFEIVHYNGPLFDLGTEPGTTARDDARLAAPEGALRPAAATDAFTPSEAFLDAAPATTLFDRCVAAGAYNGVAARYGAGWVVLFGSHPEFGFDAIQLGWGPAARLVANALLRRAREPGPPAGAARGDGGGGGTPEQVEAAPGPTDGAADDAPLRDRARATADRLDAVATSSAWLAPGHAASFLGRDPATLWSEATADAADAAHLAAAGLRRLADAPVSIAAAARWIDDPGQADQDFGFVGLAQLAGRMDAALTNARDGLDASPTPLAHAYDQFDSHPYQLAAGSYLSAAGLAAGALLATAVAARLCGAPDDALEAHLLRDPRVRAGGASA